MTTKSQTQQTKFNRRAANLIDCIRDNLTIQDAKIVEETIVQLQWTAFEEGEIRGMEYAKKKITRIE